MKNDIWSVQVTLDGSNYLSFWASEVRAREVHQRWLDHSEEFEPNENLILTCEGFDNPLTRNAAVISWVASETVAMTISKV